MSKRNYFPMFVDISQKQILVIGAGNIACRRINTLLLFCKNITVVAPCISEQIEKLPVNIVHRCFEKQDLDNIDIAIIATDNNKLNEEIAEYCMKKNIIKNVITDRKLCDFYFPGIICSEKAVVAISTSGESPSETKRIKEKIKNTLDT